MLKKASTPESAKVTTSVTTPSSSSTLSRLNGMLSRSGRHLIASFAPLPRFACDLTLLSVKVALAVIAASARLVVPPSKKSLMGETVLITGAGDGIGRELALQLAALGCIVVCWDSDVEANRATMSVVSKDGGEVHGFAVDVSKRLEVREGIRLMRKRRIPEVSILINNAAVLVRKPFLEHEDEEIQRMLDVNVLAQIWTIQTFLPAMLRNKRGHIVCMCSMCGVPDEVAYCASKYAARGLMEGLIEEVRSTTAHAGDAGINFTTVYPFYVDTGLARDPKYRFPCVFGAVSAEYAAKEVIRAIRSNYEECSIPRCLLYLDAVNRLVPKRAMRLMIDFLARADKKDAVVADGAS